jgi:hypothetical protein
MCVSGLPQFFDSFCMFLLCHGAWDLGASSTITKSRWGLEAPMSQEAVWQHVTASCLHFVFARIRHTTYLDSCSDCFVYRKLPAIFRVASPTLIWEVTRPFWVALARMKDVTHNSMGKGSLPHARFGRMNMWWCDVRFHAWFLFFFPEDGFTIAWRSFACLLACWACSCMWSCIDMYSAWLRLLNLGSLAQDPLRL